MNLDNDTGRVVRLCLLRQGSTQNEAGLRILPVGQCEEKKVSIQIAITNSGLYGYCGLPYEGIILRALCPPSAGLLPKAPR